MYFIKAAVIVKIYSGLSGFLEAYIVSAQEANVFIVGETSTPK
jgi:hypothetical protein